MKDENNEEKLWIHGVYNDFLKESKKDVDFFVFLEHWSKIKGKVIPSFTKQESGSNDLKVIENIYLVLEHKWSCA